MGFSCLVMVRLFSQSLSFEMEHGHNMTTASSAQVLSNSLTLTCISSLPPSPLLTTDDDLLVCKVAQRLLHLLGFRTLLAHDGQAGVDTLRAHAHEIALVMLDLVMPRMGLRLVQLPCQSSG